MRQLDPIIQDALGVTSLPTGFLVDSTGIVRYRWHGHKPKRNLLDILTTYYNTGKIPLKHVGD